MTKYFLTLFVVSLSAICLAQNASISGKVSDNQVGMEGIIVDLNGKNEQRTDKDGRFLFTNLQTGTYELKVHQIGYETISKIIQLTNENEKFILPDLILKNHVLQISEIIIKADPLPYSNKYAGSNETISQKEIEQTKAVGTEELLKKVAGVNVSGDMGISNRLNVGIRGSYPRRSGNILIMEDGTPIAPAPYLAPEAYYNPPSDRLDGIEIIKGADILAFGSNTMYGAINYLTKNPPAKPTLRFNVAGGNNGYQSQYLTYGGTWNKLGAEIQILNKNFDGFQDNSQSHIFNTTAKLYLELNERSSIYMKLNYHYEKSKATYSALTPFTFAISPTQNPFDADDLATNRMAIDLIHNYKLTKNWVLSSKVYASQFQRFWWRQDNTVIKASNAENYLGSEIYNERYSYLKDQTFGENDYIRVGRVTNGKESTRARNRTFKVIGVQETLKYQKSFKKSQLMMEGNVRAHWEFFYNEEIKNDSSRFSRSGTLDKDQLYELGAYSAFAKAKWSIKKWHFTPSLRFEHVEMYSYDILAISKLKDNDGSKRFGSQKNTFSKFIPGFSAQYDLFHKRNQLMVFAGMYQGYTAPVADFAFLNVEDGVVSKPTADKPINRLPEISMNYEAGLRGQVIKSSTNIQLVYFNNSIQNFYSAGRNEAFQTLGSVNINGLETSVQVQLNRLLEMGRHEVSIGFSGTFMDGKILSGILQDADLLKALHTSNTKAELIDKINRERNGYDVYFTSGAGKDSLINRDLTVSDFSAIRRLDLRFGEGGIAQNTLPYVPKSILNFRLNYAYKGFSAGINFNFVEKQYTDYLNFENETAEGAIGLIPAFQTLDANIAYNFESSKNKYISGLSVFIAGKNLTNEIFMASRLHRLSSGIMPGGFRQINAGLNWTIK